MLRNPFALTDKGLAQDSFAREHEKISLNLFYPGQQKKHSGLVARTTSLSNIEAGSWALIIGVPVNLRT